MGLLFVNKLPAQYECLTTDYNLRDHTWKHLYNLNLDLTIILYGFDLK